MISAIFIQGGISGKLLNYIVKLKQGKAKRNVSQVFK